MGAIKHSYRKLPSLYPTLCYFTEFTLELGSLWKFLFPEVGGAAGKGRMPRAELSEGTTCTNLCPSFPLPEPHRFRKSLFLSTPPTRSFLPAAFQALALGEARW